MSHPKIQHVKNLLKVARYDEPYTVLGGKSIRTYVLLVKANRSESGELGSISAEC